jgi:NAD(P)H-quinone oxidoreductase subunit 5
MTPKALALFISIAPLLFILTAFFSWFQSGLRPKLIKSLSIFSTLVSILIAMVCSYLVFEHGLLETPFIGYAGIGISLRIDAVSMIMFSMIALLSFIIFKFSLNYLDGDQRQGAFLGRLAATLASVQLLVLSGNTGILFISWVLTSVSLHRLLIFYKERPGAIVAARKKFIVARLADISLFAATIILYSIFGTGNLEFIFQAIKESTSTALNIGELEVVALLIALAAIFKSAQFPTHGWLVEVMETPTSVSALLHAGLLNAGPFLVVRLAYIMEATSYASFLLIGLGATTALFASVVFLTQSSIKTALGYSSIGHMGFSLMVCGLGVYPAAMLHLVAHSFYKAHAFLSTGSVIDLMSGAKVSGAKRTGKPLKIIAGILLGLGVYVGFAFLFGLNFDSQFQLLAIGAIIVMGLSRIFTSALDSTASGFLFFQASLLSGLVTLAFFTLEAGFHDLMMAQVPEITLPTSAETILTLVILVIFGLTVFMQIIAPTIASNQSYSAWSIHLKNGLYVNAVFDRMVKALYQHGK